MIDVLKKLLKGVRSNLDDLAEMRKKADQKLDDIEAMLDGEDQWFIKHYSSKNNEGPACELPKRPNDTSKT